MTNQQILEKAIQKAVEGGWEPTKRDHRYTWPPKKIIVSESYGDNGESGWDLFVPEPHIFLHLCDAWDAEDLIFNHKFAKALWGEEQRPFTLDRPTTLEDEARIYYKPKWQVMLQRMVIADDPIKYLGENI